MGRPARSFLNTLILVDMYFSDRVYAKKCFNLHVLRKLFELRMVEKFCWNRMNKTLIKNVSTRKNVKIICI